MSQLSALYDFFRSGMSISTGLIHKFRVSVTVNDIQTAVSNYMHVNNYTARIPNQHFFFNFSYFVF